MTVKSLALAALLSAVAATSFAQGPSTNTASPTTPATCAMAPAPTGSTSGKAMAADKMEKSDKGMHKGADKAMHGDKGMHKGEMKKSNNTAAPAASGAK